MPRSVLLCLVALAVAGCTTSSEKVASKPVSDSGGTTKTLSLRDFKVRALPYANAQVTLKGTPLKGTISVVEAGSRFTLATKLNDQEFDEEIYEGTDSKVSYVGSKNEYFTPPIPLLNASIEVPSQTTWKGTLSLAGHQFPATSTIKLSQDSLNIFGGPYETIKALVLLEVDTDGPKPLKRTMTFWFDPEAGIVQRAFDDSSLRAPWPEESAAVSESTPGEQK